MANKPSRKKAPNPAETTQAPVSNAETAPTASVEPVQLTVADLQTLARIVDLASRRGAFQAAELTQVGEAYNKLTGFLNYVDSVQAKDKEEAAGAETSAAQ